MTMLLQYSLLFSFLVILGFGKTDKYIVVVDHVGHITKFLSIQAAINSVPLNNMNWVTINIGSGIHREKISIPANKGHLFLKGAERDTTKVVWDDHNDTRSSYTFESWAENILVVGISFVNSYNYPPGPKMKNPVKQAVAAIILGDKTAFKNCSFLGYQDTMWDHNGRHYFKQCKIEGGVDFIFGGGQSIYHDCDIILNIGMLQPNFVGFITANGRENPQDNSGFIFKGCNVFGTGNAYLGRAWRPHARVIYYQTNMANIIVPQGWDAWSGRDHKNQLTFAEEQCKGPGANKSDRVKWEASLSSATLQQFTNLPYINSDRWLEMLPIDMIHH